MLADAYPLKVELNRRDPMIVVPAVFSIIDDPVSALHLLLPFAKVARQNKVQRLKVDQSAMIQYDLAANIVLGIIATELRAEAKQRKTIINFSGRYPKPLAAQRFVRSVGIVKQLDVANQTVSAFEQQNLRIFDKRNYNYRESEDPTKADFKSRSCAQFVEHFNECLHDHGRELTRESVQRLGAYITEILGNAEDHPGFKDWTVQGYLDNSLDVPTCEIAIVNFGMSIAETMKKAGKYIWSQISTIRADASWWQIFLGAGGGNATCSLSLHFRSTSVPKTATRRTHAGREPSNSSKSFKKFAHNVPLTAQSRQLWQYCQAAHTSCLTGNISLRDRATTSMVKS
ncbi:MAG: hypothetical protein CBARDMAM_4260 [uncultured Caballeronia sp.]|nr:MAG: hypothetical protein CBARDMAM_4260 [uncultured Caballeronia sp.]